MASCSLNKAVDYLVSNNLVKPSMELYTPLPSDRLTSLLDRWNKLALNKHKVDMGPLFHMRFTERRTAFYDVGRQNATVTKIFLEPNTAAFEAIDRSAAQELDKIRKASDEAYMTSISKEKQVSLEYQKIQEEGNFVVSDEGNVEVPRFLPKINIRC